MIPDGRSLIVVTPVYEDAEAAARLFTDLQDLFGDGLFVVAVDDGSVQQPLPVSVLTRGGTAGVVLRLRRNVGHQRAIAVGLGWVADRLGPGHRVVVMDCDGEDRPGSVPALLKALEPDTVDVVVAARGARVESLRFKAFYALYKRFFAMMTGRAISFGNFMALKPRAVSRLVAMQELPIHVAATVLASKLRLRMTGLDRGPRYAGQSKMNFVGLVLHGFKALMVFAEDVLVRVGIACAGVALLAFLGASLAVVLKLIGLSSPGWFSIALGILVLIFLQTGALALMTLLLTGVMRGGAVNLPGSYRDFIDSELSSATAPPGPAPVGGR